MWNPLYLIIIIIITLALDFQISGPLRKKAQERPNQQISGKQWSSTFLMLFCDGHPAITLFLLILHNCNFVVVVNLHVNICVFWWEKVIWGHLSQGGCYPWVGITNIEYELKKLWEVDMAGLLPARNLEQTTERGSQSFNEIKKIPKGL